MLLPVMLCTDLSDLVTFPLVQPALLLLLSSPEHRIIVQHLAVQHRPSLEYIHLSIHILPLACFPELCMLLANTLMERCLV